MGESGLLRAWSSLLLSGALLLALTSTTAQAAPVPPAATWTAPSTPTSAASLTYTLTFSKPVTGIEARDFANFGKAKGCSFSPSASSGTVITVTVENCQEDTVVVALAAKSVWDSSKVLGPAVAVAASSVKIDRTKPTIASLSTSTTNTNLSTITYTLKTSETITGLSGDDFTNTGTAENCVFNPKTTAGSSIAVEVSGCSEGDLIVKLLADSIQDAAGNIGPAGDYAAGPTTIDRTKPTQDWTAIPASPNKNSGIYYEITFSEPVLSSTVKETNFSNVGSSKGCVFSVASDASVTVVWKVRAYVSKCTSGTLVVRFNPTNIQDQAGNREIAPPVAMDSVPVVIDASIPAATWTIPASPTNASSLSYQLRFSEEVSGLDKSDFLISGKATGCSVAPLDASSGTEFTVTVSGCSEGAAVLSLKANAVKDAVLNPGPTIAVPAAQVFIDRTVPVATWGPCSVTSCTLTFSEPVSGIASDDFAFAGTSSGWAVGSLAVASTGTSATIRYSASVSSTTGTIVWKLLAGQVTDRAGNTGPLADVSSRALSYNKK